MTAVTVVVPWRAGDADRAAALAWLTARYAQLHPEWEVRVTPGLATGGPWIKAHAVQAALSGAAGEVLVVADADVVCDGVTEAVDAVVRGQSWAVPHHAVHRLTAAATRRVYDTGVLPDVRLPRSLLRGTVAEAHRGVAGGGMVVVRRDVWDACPLDARFRGWGQEDLAWGWALTRCFGSPYRAQHPMIHLWHPPQERQSRVAGSTESMSLYARYRQAFTREEVLALLGEEGARPAG